MRANTNFGTLACVSEIRKQHLMVIQEYLTCYVETKDERYMQWAKLLGEQLPFLNTLVKKYDPTR
jgi:hypothetical protein